MLSAKEIKQIAQKVISENHDYDAVGIRMQDELHGLEIGDKIEHKSYIWIDGERTDDTLDGVSAVDAEMAAQYNLGFGYYAGEYILILGGNYYSHGEDDGEIIMQAPTVINIIKI
ncbi:MAG: hypothetical protein DRJ03_01450 [Chloroflexi bacterium]|nr:MAG: hypothetical protein DRJ03_01450 [Chloroflexota bacterium]